MKKLSPALLAVVFLFVFSACVPGVSLVDNTDQANQIMDKIDPLLAELALDDRNIAESLEAKFTLNNESLEVEKVDDVWLVNTDDFSIGVSIDGMSVINKINQATLSKVKLLVDELVDLGRYQIRDSDAQTRAYGYSSTYYANLPLTVNPNRIGLSIQNSTDSVMSIVWNESTFVDKDGSSNPVMHIGVKYTDASASKPDSIIAPNARIDDVIINSNAVVRTSNDWIIEDFFNPNDFTTQPATIGALLTLKIGEEKQQLYMNFTTKVVN